MKSCKGITLTILVITIIIMLILAGVVVYEVEDNVKISDKIKMYNDIELLEDKINLYNLQYGTIPIKGEFTGTDDFMTDKNPNDSGAYYIIDLSLIDNLTLNYDVSGVGNDVYIINETTHTIYYPKGITTNEGTFYRLPEKYTLID